MWLGYLERGARGALAVALPFVLPPFLIVTVVAVLYTEYQGLPWVQDVFFGVGPAVMAIIAIAAVKLARATNKHDPVLWGVAAILCAATAAAGAEIVWLFPGRRQGLCTDRLRRPARHNVRARRRRGRHHRGVPARLLFVVAPGRLFRPLRRAPAAEGLRQGGGRPPRQARSRAPRS